MHLDLSQPRHTQRLKLRGLTMGDLGDLHAYRSLESTCRYIPPEPMTRGEIEERLETRWATRSLSGEGEGLLIGVEHVASSVVIGDISLQLTSANDRNGEIGWVLNPKYSGKGYATEAAHGVLHIAFDELGVRRLVARIDARNQSSLRLAERLGMRQEAYLVENELFKGELTDEVDYALLSREWESQHLAGRCAFGYKPASPSV
ncbi:GNAT family N-acetyltransferase [Ferrimicrobium acidiphilum]|uniref:GNAT family N-acetyltransferase n=1 Tax=Ferrimicrobium acidiphilum TaxID=121039 RepID=UPI0023EF8089|nr:GNAT family N-acetyltransferase [Ferrimicrobium acidiphilum]